MKLTRYISAAVIALVTMISCEKDGSFITVDGGDGDVVLDGNIGDIVLDFEKVNSLALTIHWTENGDITLSDTLVTAPEYAVQNTVQFSADEQFASIVDFVMDKGEYSRQFTVGELNNIVGRLGFGGGKASPLYIRVKSVIGENIEADYSNVLVVNVTPYVIDMTVGFCLDKDKAETGITLYSAESNGIYTGFVGVSGWTNWWMREGNGMIWGNLGVDGNIFKISSDASSWNMWYPEPSGCYYTTVDTQISEWTALNIPLLSVSGDVAGDMTFDKASVTWALTFDNVAAGSKNILISGTGKLYSNATSDMGPAIDTPVGFGGTADDVTFVKADATPIAVEVNSTGTVTLKLNLSDPANWTITVEEGAAPPPVVVGEYLYMSGIDDGINGGNWTFDNYLTLYNADERSYAGAVNVNSLWGYQFYTEKDNWSSNYTMAGGDAASGSLKEGGSDNIAAPEAGLYVMNVSLSKLTYILTKVETVSYSGLNDDWGVYAMTATETPGIYTADVQKTAPTPWGVKILINGSWEVCFGGGDGVLRYGHDGFKGDDDFANGTLVLTVDLCKGTYSYSAK